MKFLKTFNESAKKIDYSKVDAIINKEVDSFDLESIDSYITQFRDLNGVESIDNILFACSKNYNFADNSKNNNFSNLAGRIYLCDFSINDMKSEIKQDVRAINHHTQAPQYKSNHFIINYISGIIEASEDGFFYFDISITFNKTKALDNFYQEMLNDNLSYAPPAELDDLIKHINESGEYYSIMENDDIEKYTIILMKLKDYKKFLQYHPE